MQLTLVWRDFKFFLLKLARALSLNHYWVLVKYTSSVYWYFSRHKNVAKHLFSSLWSDKLFYQLWNDLTRVFEVDALFQVELPVIKPLALILTVIP